MSVYEGISKECLGRNTLSPNSYTVLHNRFVVKRVYRLLD
jgi:hypothetical protein